MYALCGVDHKSLTCLQFNERQGIASYNGHSIPSISDVYFVALAMGKASVVESTVKQVTSDGVELESGGQLQVDAIFKAIGSEPNATFNTILNMTLCMATGRTEIHGCPFFMR